MPTANDNKPASGQLNLIRPICCLTRRSRDEIVSANHEFDPLAYHIPSGLEKPWVGPAHEWNKPKKTFKPKRINNDAKTRPKPMPLVAFLKMKIDDDDDDDEPNIGGKRLEYCTHGDKGI